MKCLFLLLLLVSATTISFAQTEVKNQPNEHQQPTLKLYPRTTDKSLNIYIELLKPTDIVVSMPGTEKNNPVSWEMNARSSYQKNIDVSNLPEGVYTIKVEGDGVSLIDSFTIKRQ